MIPKIKEINTRLDRLEKRRSSLGLSKIMSEGASSKVMKARPQPTSVMDETIAYVGRDDEKREMLELLKRNNGAEDGVSVISIVGIGGMGKTTLAQLIYNDASIQHSFDHKAWVCVSDDFDAIKVTKSILKFIAPSEACDDNDLSLLQEKIKEKLSGKKFLLVLDDIWDISYNEWTILRSPFGVGTKIIVTTRFQSVSSNMVTMKSFHLDKLSHVDCLSIFTQHALGARDFNGHLDFKDVGENIVRRCSGLPLAAKVIGGLLRTTRDRGAWENIYESEIWDLPEDPCGIVPALRLSYHHLPPHLKQCFAYCSILPKDYEFEEEEIILLWRAEGLLQQKAGSQCRGFGSQCFRDLVSRSFFQMSDKGESLFVMHDLINDLAQFVAGKICSKFEGNKQQEISRRTRHLSYVQSEFDGVMKFEAFDQVEHLRTFLPLRLQRTGTGLSFLTDDALHKLLPRLSCLRVLSFSGYWITELPDIFENLKHLRYLDFSRTLIKCLPDSLFTLYHLETLKLNWCMQLEILPPEIENLVNLHYLDIRGARLIKGMPSGIGLENVVKGQDAWEAKLSEKSEVDKLELKWSGDFGNKIRNKEVEEEVLNFLCPHRKKLEELSIVHYGGAKFSVWIADSSFVNMLSLKLINCQNCISLPSIGKLPRLKNLYIGGMDEVKEIGVEFFGENQPNAFASLEDLCFEDMLNWKDWDSCESDDQVSKFPKLRLLSILECPELLGRLPNCLHSLQELVIRGCQQLVVSISRLPLLCELEIHGCKELMYSNCVDVTSLKRVSLLGISKFGIPPERIVSTLTKLESFRTGGCKELASLSQNGLGFLGHLSSLRDIEISDCPQLVSSETEEVNEEKLQLGKISSIESLTIKDCERLNRLPKALHSLTFLAEIQIGKCPSLVSFAKNKLPPALKRLMIWDCDNLQYLVDERENKSTSNECLLERLEIRGCNSLICLSSRSDFLIRLGDLRIDSCQKLTSLFLKLPATLKLLQIFLCPKLECIAQEFHQATCLESIRISSCMNIKSLPQGIEKLSHLQEIRISRCPNLVSLEQIGSLANLRIFTIEDCENFGALPRCMKNFTSLQELNVCGCSADVSFPEEGFPSNLTSLEISKAPKIYGSLVEWGLHRLTSLRQLRIGGEGCSDVVSFPEEKTGMMLPPSLTHISIRNFENLKYMFSKGFQNLTSLRSLYISDCSKLNALPDKDMLLSVEELRILDCPLLKEKCKRGKRREWSKIAHIPLVEMDGFEKGCSLL
ncbi:putative disease resistance RPP13-like protein 1 isoform X2 [Durio zibethinus]|uniref:Disease resistance RPP13-like protein 1 isoform X2 n=1 Tax=Durio zibethinus TaxID=66656 RepID=A0A6P5WMN6_DURZI|nr:putative disease resistance RPP13-like protein 1 isoform X2 [Durio zibethinus]